MGLLTSAMTAPPASLDRKADAARQVEAMVLKTMIDASGAFKGGDGPGASIHAQMFTEALADAVAGQKSLGLAQLLDPHQVHAAPTAPTPSASRGANVAAPAGLVVAGATHLSSGFGARQDPIDHHQSFHSGLDIAAPNGSPILAAASGTVVSAGPRGGYGNAVEIAHADGTTTLYGHVADFDVHPGQVVKAGEPIATVGSTGRSTGNHLHFEVRSQGRPVEPWRALQKYHQRDEEGPSSASFSSVTHED